MGISMAPSWPSSELVEIGHLTLQKIKLTALTILDQLYVSLKASKMIECADLVASFFRRKLSALFMIFLLYKQPPLTRKSFFFLNDFVTFS